MPTMSAASRPDTHTLTVWPGCTTRSRLSAKLSNSIATGVRLVTSMRTRLCAGASISLGLNPPSATLSAIVGSSAARAMPQTGVTRATSARASPASLIEIGYQFHTAGRPLSSPFYGRRLHPVHAVLATRAAAALAAVCAHAVELDAVAAHDEAQKPADALLEPLELLARELDDLPAALADDVVVGSLLAFDRLVAGLPVVEVPLGGEPALLEQPQRAVDRRVAHARVHAAHGAVELLDREVLARREEHPRDIVPLRRRLEPALAQGLLEALHPGAHRHPRLLRRPPRDARAGGAAPA